MVLLVCAFPFIGTRTAFGDTVSDAQAVLNDAEAQMNQLSTEYNELAGQIDEMQTKIDDLSVEVMSAQDAMLEGRAALSETVQYEYRSNTISSMLSILLGSKNMQELFQNIEYIACVTQYWADSVEDQKERKAEFEKLSDEVTKEKDSQEVALAELESKCAEAQTVVNDASAKLANAEAEEAARLAALQAQAEQLEQAKSQNTSVALSDATSEINQNTGSVDSGGSSEGSTNNSSVDSSNNSSGVANSSNSNGGSYSETSSPSQNYYEESTPSYSEEVYTPSQSDTSSNWLSGAASAYGGSTDPSTPNPSYTATGAICDDYSMGVAVPMSLSNYRSYFGRTVEISYGGMTVYATVNDCGYMGGGSRALDLQPGVFKAFGYSSCNAWGVRTVSYRFL